MPMAESKCLFSKNPTLEEKRNPVHARREPEKPNVITINHGYKEIPQFITPYRTKRNLLWGSFTGILDRECVEITGESSEKHNTMMYGGGIGYDRLELLTPKMPIYIKFGLNLTCTTSPKNSSVLFIRTIDITKHTEAKPSLELAFL